ncbi:MAG: YciI family protein [Gordonia sp. (in: high G+C Gram-positive bacteria)]
MKYFILEGKHLVPLAEIPAELRQAHFDFLEAGMAAGHFLASGPKVGVGGGFLLARAQSRDDLDDIISTEPFTSNGVMVFEKVQEAFPRQNAPFADDWFGKSAV